MAKKKGNNRKEFVVFGLGKFGLSVAKTLADNGCQVMAVDSEQSKVEEIAEDVTYAVCTDVTDADAIHSLGIRNFDGAIVANVSEQFCFLHHLCSCRCSLCNDQASDHTPIPPQTHQDIVSSIQFC